MTNPSDPKLAKIRTQTSERYRMRFETYGLDPKSLGWGQHSDQQTRFAQVQRLVELDGKHILDVGCGFGDFYGFLVKRGWYGQYTGVDVCPEFVEQGRLLYPQACLMTADLMLDDNLPKVDIVIMLGLLNFRQTEMDNIEYASLLIKRAFTLADEAVICDFISVQRHPDYPQEPWIYYYTPGKVLELATKLTNRWAILQDYPPIPQREMMLKLMRETLA